MTRSRVISCILVNQLATPGLGSMMAGWLITGLLQLLFAVGGFVLVLVWFVKFMTFYYSMGMRTHGMDTFSGHWIGALGAGLFFFAWFWCLLMGLVLLRRVNREPPARTPPPIT